MLHSAFCAILFIFIASLVSAGPWLRAPDTHFAAIAVESLFDPDLRAQRYNSIYYEYGVHPKGTLGADIGANSLGHSKAFGFWRTALWQGGNARAAFEVGIGSQTTGAGTGFAVRPGLSWGRNVQMAGLSGWLAVDATYTMVPEFKRSIAKLETTLGLNFASNNKITLKATAEKESGETPLFTISPGFAFAISERTFLTTEIIHAGRNPARVKLGVWLQF